MVVYGSEGPEAGTVDDAEGCRDAHCGAAKYGGLVRWRRADEQSV
jgi:hypothetical protein